MDMKGGCSPQNVFLTEDVLVHVGHGRKLFFQSILKYFC
ncbi:MAG: hypothetical protein QOJ05_98 [Verrucomicrobiota bacterium]|jgi:hypothetical protein